MKKLSVGLLLCITFLIPACGPEDALTFTDISTLISMTKNLVELSKELGQGTEEIKSNIVSATTAAAEKIETTSDNQEMVAATQTLSDQWVNINTSYTQLRQTLNNINDSANNYFKTLATNNHFIKNADLRQKDEQKTTELQSNWQVQYNIASNDMLAVDSLISQGNDFKIMLTDAIARSQVNSFLDSLKNISMEARRLAGDIKNFSRNVTDLFKVADIPTYDEAAKPAETPSQAQPEIKDTSSPIRDAPAPQDATPNNAPAPDQAPPAAAPTASCNRIWLEHNVFNSGQKGMYVHGDLSFINCKEENCSCSATLSSESGELPIPGDPLHISLKPGYDNTRFNDVVVFIPYNLLNQQTGEHPYKVMLNLFNNSRQSMPMKIGESESATFTYSVQ